MTTLYHDHEITRALNAAISSTQTMDDLGVDYEIIRARLKLIKEIADSLGVEIIVPSRKQTLIQRFFGEGR